MSTQRSAGSPSAVDAQGEGSSAENIAAAKATGGALPPIAPKEGPPLSNLTNQDLGASGATSSMVPCSTTRVVKTNQGGSPSITDSTSSIPSLSVNATKGDVLTDIEVVDNVASVDEDSKDPQLCVAHAYGIYKHLRISEMMKRPSNDYMEKIQQDITSRMRSNLVDWIVKVAEKNMFYLDTLYLAVNYVDRYLSGNSINRDRLLLLGVACTTIAAKFQEISAPPVEMFSYLTYNTYNKEEVLQMESSVLKCLNYEMYAPTINCFLKRFVRVARARKEVSTLQLVSMAKYIAELSLPEYHMLRYAPSMIAASAVFLANYILLPSRIAWDTALQHDTLYEPPHLQDCVQDLLKLCSSSHNTALRPIQRKYSQLRYALVAKKECPPMIPPEYFCTVSGS